MFIFQAVRMTAVFRSLKKLGLEIAARPFYYSDTPQLVLDSFLNYTSAINYRVRSWCRASEEFNRKEKMKHCFPYCQYWSSEFVWSFKVMYDHVLEHHCQSNWFVTGAGQIRESSGIEKLSFIT